MPRTLTERPPQQARSRETLRRMLDAAEVVVLKYGPERATLPRIANQAHLSPLACTAASATKTRSCEPCFAVSTSGAAQALAEFDDESVRMDGFIPFSREVIQGMVRGSRANAALNRTAIQYCERLRRQTSSAIKRL
jgi:hypothetical protein